MKKIIFFITFLLFILFFYTLIPIEGTKGTALIEIKKGESIKTIAKKLEEKGVIKNWAVFYMFFIFTLSLRVKHLSTVTMSLKED